MFQISTTLEDKDIDTLLFVFLLIYFVYNITKRFVVKLNLKKNDGLIMLLKLIFYHLMNN